MWASRGNVPLSMSSACAASGPRRALIPSRTSLFTRGAGAARRRSPPSPSLPLPALCFWRFRARSAPRLRTRDSRRRSATSAATMHCARLIFCAGYHTRLRWLRRRTRRILAVSASRLLARRKQGRRMRSDQDASPRAAQHKGCTVWIGCCNATDDGCVWPGTGSPFKV